MPINAPAPEIIKRAQVNILLASFSSCLPRAIEIGTAEPTATRQTDVYGAFCASVRYKWLVRDNFSMYSGLGAGISLGLPIPIPYVAPIGIKFGKGKVYGIVEANISAATTFGMAGIGIKL